MKTVVVRYTTRSETADENQTLVEKVFQELQAVQPSGLRYATLRLADGVTFVHVARIETEDGTNPLSSLASFNDFTSDIERRCDAPPLAQDATVVGAYRCFGD